MIVFNKPYYTGAETELITTAFASNSISGDGAFGKRTQMKLEQRLGVKKVLLTTSCTHALEMAAILLNLKQGDEVIVPSYTFVSTVLAFVMHGARPVFADIRPDTLNIDETKLEELITPNTKAIVIVHYAGVACEMDAIMAVTKNYDLALIEDNAHGLCGKYKGKFLGSFGDFSTLSFHETKNITCGEGGALLINDESHIQRAEIIREKGTDRSRFFRGEIDKYSWVDVGSSYVLSDILAAFLFAQLVELDQIQLLRKKVWDFYYMRLETWASDNEVSLPTIPSECEQAYHMFYLIMPSLESRSKFINYLRAKGISAVFHYLPLHSSKMGSFFLSDDAECPVSATVSSRLVRLPFFTGISRNELDEVVSAIKSHDVVNDSNRLF